MPADPRLDALMQYAMSELGAGPTDQTAMLRQRIDRLELLVAVLLRTPSVQVGSGAPTQTARDGTLYIDQTNLRLYARILGNWRFLGPFS